MDERTEPGAAAPAYPRSLRETVYEHLRDLLTRGHLRPGNYLDLNGLAAEIGVSRTPLRDALLRLESEGFVVIENRKGVRIAALTMRKIRDIYQILGGLESVSLANASSRLTPEHVAEMDTLNGEIAAALEAGDFPRYYEANTTFHNTWLDLCRNRELVRWVRILKQRLYDFPRLSGYVPEWEDASLLEHRHLVALLAAGAMREAVDYLRDVHWSFDVQEPFIRRYYAQAAENEGGEH